MPEYKRVQSAYKNYPEADIKKGEPYYWKQLTGGTKVRYKTKPIPSKNHSKCRWYCGEGCPAETY